MFFNENGCISIRVSLKFVPNGQINNIPALFQIMAWRRLGDHMQAFIWTNADKFTDAYWLGLNELIDENNLPVKYLWQTSLLYVKKRSASKWKLEYFKPLYHPRNFHYIHTQKWVAAQITVNFERLVQDNIKKNIKKT